MSVNRPTTRPTPRRATALAAGVLCLAGALAAAQPPPAEPPTEPPTLPPPAEPVGEFSEQLAVSWVLVPVLVENGRGYVEGLGRDAFRLWVDGERVPIADFESGATAPVSLVFLQDLSGSMANGDKLAAAKRALAHLLARARPEDEFALASFAGGRLQVEVPFTRDGQVLAEAMELWRGYGTTAIHDAVAWIPQIALDGRHAKRAAVLVSDGLDNASRLAPEAARQVVSDARLPVYVLEIRQLGDLAAAGPADSYALLLAELARASGGRYFAVRPDDGVAAAAAGVLDELRRQYVLAFPTQPGEVGYRLLQVEVDAPGHVTIYHRRGYRGGPPAMAR